MKNDPFSHIVLKEELLIKKISEINNKLTDFQYKIIKEKIFTDIFGIRSLYFLDRLLINYFPSCG